MFAYAGIAHIATTDIEPNTWFNFTATKLDNVIRLYLNGNLVLEEQTSGTPRFGTEFRFGQKSQNGDGWWTGKIDSTRIYNRALSEAEVASLYALESGENQFQIIEGDFSWQEAKADAESKGGRLAVLNTQEKIDAANSYLRERGDWPYLLIGLTDEVVEGDWRWITGESLTVTSWNGGEPNNSGNEDYAVINSNSIYWNDGPFNRDGVWASYLFEKTIPEYQIVEGNFTWHEAKADAEAKGGRLAVLDTQAKIDAVDDFINSVTGPRPRLFLGATDEINEGVWKWVTGETITLPNWADGEPNGSNSQNYLSLSDDPTTEPNGMIFMGPLVTY